MASHTCCGFKAGPGPKSRPQPGQPQLQARSGDFEWYMTLHLNLLSGDPAAYSLAKTIRGTSRFFSQKYFTTIRGFEVLPSLFPSVVTVFAARGFGCRKVSGIGRSGRSCWGARVACGLTRALWTHRAPATCHRGPRSPGLSARPQEPTF